VHLVSPAVKLETLVLLFGVTGFLALRSPLALIAVPTVSWRFISDNEGYWQSTWHYSVILMPVVFAAGIDGLRAAGRSRRSWLRAYASHVPAIMVAVAVALCWRFPFKDLVQPETYRPSDRAATASAVLELIPSGSSVETDTGLMSRLTSRCRVFWAGGAGGVVPDYVLVDDQSGWSSPPDAADWGEQAHPGVSYVTVFDGDGYSLARRAPG